MITRRTLVILGGALVVLAGISWLTSKKRYSTVEGGGFASVLSAKVDSTQVQSIKAWLGGKPDSAVVLERAGDGWQVASRWGWTAKTDLVKQLLRDLSDLTGEVRSSDPKVLADYEIDDEKGLHVVAAGSGGSEIFHLVGGKTAAAGGAFVRREGSNAVFVTRSSLRSSFGVWGEPPRVPDPKRWLDLEIQRVERNDVDRVILTAGGVSTVFEKEFAMTVPPPVEPAAGDTANAPSPEPAVPAIDRTNWTWKKDARGELDKNKVDGILGTLCSLYAAEISDPASLDQYGFGEGAKVAELVLQDGTTKRVEFGSDTADEKRVYFRAAGGLPAEIYKSTVDRIFLARKELTPEKK